MALQILLFNSLASILHLSAQCDKDDVQLDEELWFPSAGGQLECLSAV